MNETLTPTIPLAAFEKLISQYHHKILSLEADLKDAAKSRSISARGFGRRVRLLQELNGELQELQKLCVAEAPGKLMGSDLGLPNLDDCTSLEREICASILREKELVVRSLEEDAKAVFHWLVSTTSGSAGVIRTIFRLSKMRRKIQCLEHNTSVIKQRSKALSGHIEKTAGHGQEPIAAR